MANRRKKKLNKFSLIIGIVIVLAVAALLIFFKGFPKESGVAAVVNYEKITLSELDRQYTNLPEQYKSILSKNDLLEQLISEKLLLQEAVSEGLIATPNEINEQLNLSIEQNKMSLKEFEDALSKEGTSLADVKEFFRKKIVIGKLLEEKLAVNVSESEIRKFYDDNMNYFTAQSGEIRIYHILVKSEDIAKEIVDKLNKNADFCALANEYSDDSTGQNCGDLGFIGTGVTVIDFEKAAFALKEGQLSGVVKTEYGFHIIKRGADIIVYSEAKPKIEEQLVAQKQKIEFQKYLGILKAKSTIKIFLQSDNPMLSNSDKFAVCVGQKSALYGRNVYCPPCEEQLKVFGNSVQYINYVDCEPGDTVIDACKDAKIQSYPAWIVNGNQYNGVKSLDELAKITGCKLEK